MSDEPRQVPVVFYQTEAGSKIVQVWLRGLDAPDRILIGQDLMRVQFRWPVGTPLCRPLSGGLWELRTNVAHNRIARVFFCFADGRLIALHGFIKKTQQTPSAELELARKRQKEFV